MVIDFSTKLLGLNGLPLRADPIVEQDGTIKGYTEATLGTVSINCLLAENPRNPTSGMQKLKRYKLAEKISYAREPLELSVEDVALIKDVIGIYEGPNTIGAAWKILEGTI